ncbi:o-succinylbenzoate--CoA ligase [Cytobacillus depressus]|uniref:O-succinylbenzoate--CoA ligase n=1 Tax=Cytobacillus depressus TaxID=1602942 RepID=A0A6L3V6X5_9BACI|nr:o-succinylbenzoate--CoA ligase [Cytobacillus depressus]KAB2336325.1 o-succinylbenzoate--CoA ligase [Cytobacillus depressus]
MQGIAYWIEKRASINPDRIAIITEHEQITYKQLEQQVNATASYLKRELGMERGERIAILSQNRDEYIILLFAIARIECIAVPLNNRLTASELIYQIRDSGTKILFAEKQFQKISHSLQAESSVEEVIEIEKVKLLQRYPNETFDPTNESAPYIICYTSGTTGKPKGAVLTQKNMFWNAMNNILAIDITSWDRSIVLLPLFHIGGIGLFAFPTLLAGGTIIIPDKFDPYKALSMIEKNKATIVMGVPTIHQALLSCPAFETTDLQSVRWFYNGGAPCPHDLIRAFLDKGLLFGQGFGMTETSPTVFMLSREDANRKIGSIGKPVLYCEYKIVDSEGDAVKAGEIGELIIRGPNVMKEYWNRPEATSEAIRDGWLYTGDLARVDDEGFIYIAGRSKDMIISGGENIYPLEVEQVIGQMADVSEVAVIGISDPKWGETAAAFVVKKKGSPLTQEEIIAYCHKFLAAYKVPKKVEFIEGLPKNATGKIQKNSLKTTG